MSVKTYQILLTISIKQNLVSSSAIFDYLPQKNSEEQIECGSYVMVPFRNQHMIGVVVSSTILKEKSPYILKSITKCFPFKMSIQDIQFLTNLSNYYLQDLALVAKMAFPNLKFFSEMKNSSYEINDATKARSSGQKNIVKMLQIQNRMTKKEILDICKVTTTTVKNMVQRGILNEFEEKTPLPKELPLKFNPSILSKEQQEAADFLIEKSMKNSHSVTLLNGVTGSGKTEVYFDVIKSILEKDLSAQILILLPEIVLTTQSIARFTKYFGVEPAIWHSELSIAEKRQNWLKTYHNKVRITISTRSGLFLPFANLKSIIIDEEHDFSYKQEDQVIYHGRNMAILKAHINKIPVILASATPSLETINNVNIGKYEQIFLKSRYQNIEMPEIKMVDSRNLGKKSNGNSWLSQEFKQMMLESLQKDQQVMIFLNRRGYAPLTLCAECGFRYMCPNCSSWLVEHKSYAKLLCHHCDFEAVKSDKCQKCDAEESFISCGPGVERINEEITLFLKEANLDKKIVMLTKDHIKSLQDSQTLINKILNNEAQIIIGTQIIAKGHDFPNLKLVCIVDADLGLEGGDLRAAEKTYQLLNQVSGRAGRHGEAGKVILQTFNPDNPVMKALSSGEQEKFIEAEINSRQAANMPPFGLLASIVMSSNSEENVINFAKNLMKISPISQNIQIFGPTPSVIYKLRNRYRYRILVKSFTKSALQPFLKQWLSQVKIDKSIRVKIDIDPYNFM